MRWMLLLSVVALSVADVAAFSGRHLVGIGHIARDQIESIRNRADEYTRIPV
ncbi:hypothetical protein [Sphingomonas sp. UNC305MFCol5.2]|uniref:hypothetical protein n=1 Tax=Sphingomonas sp. UNC305MFCol5.2 TaxID=1449076 RepID=UPI001E512FEB|nr:hypothetical protein [Sphingomonas sp. UNC305MFCol5.2]